MTAVLTIDNLRVEADGVALIDGLSLTLAPGTILGLVGESGSGKSMTVMSIPGLLPAGCGITGGRIRLGDRDLANAAETTLRGVRGSEIGVVFQDPFTSFNPVRRVGSLLEESLCRHSGLGKHAARAATVSALAEVGLADPEQKADAYPHQLSGGQRQRALIALALANRPRLLIADEPTTALDATVQIEILDLLKRAAAQVDGACIFVTHDLGAAAYLCDEIAVMYAGRIVEIGPMAEVVATPRHPYTRQLLDCVPRLGRESHVTGIPGSPPTPRERGVGCAFAPRCLRASSHCREHPELSADGVPGVSRVACWHPLGDMAS